MNRILEPMMMMMEQEVVEGGRGLESVPEIQVGRNANEKILLRRDSQAKPIEKS